MARKIAIFGGVLAGFGAIFLISLVAVGVSTIPNKIEEKIKAAPVISTGDDSLNNFANRSHPDAVKVRNSFSFA
jgi:hypothetical protein